MYKGCLHENDYIYYSLSGGLPTAIVVHIIIMYMYFIYSGQINISVCLSLHLKVESVYIMIHI